MKRANYVHNLRSIDLNLLGVFDAIYTERSITRAAKRLGVSQPGVSGALGRLRELLGDPLFVKTASGMEPTSRADELAEPISDALDSILDALNQQAGFNYAEVEHRFCLAMSDYSEYVFLPPLMQWLRKNALNISLKIVPVVDETLPRDLESGAVDLAIGNIPSLQTGCYRQRLVFEDFICAVRADHPEIGDELTLNQFETIPQIIFAPRKDETTMDHVLSEKGLKRKIALSIPNYLTIVSIVEQTDLVGILPMRIASRACDTTRVKLLKSPVEYLGVPVNQHWHERKNNNPANKWLRELLKDITETLVAADG